MNGLAEFADDTGTARRNAADINLWWVSKPLNIGNVCGHMFVLVMMSLALQYIIMSVLNDNKTIEA